MSKRKQKPVISDAERAVLFVLWDDGPGTVREIQERLDAQGQAWARSTVITLLQRLEKKRYVASDKSSFAFIFRAAISRDKVLHERITQLARELTAGKPAPLVLAFAQQHRFTDQEIAEFRELIERLESSQSRRQSDK